MCCVWCGVVVHFTSERVFSDELGTSSKQCGAGSSSSGGCGCSVLAVRVI